MSGSCADGRSLATHVKIISSCFYARSLIVRSIAAQLSNHMLWLVVCYEGKQTIVLQPPGGNAWTTTGSRMCRVIIKPCIKHRHKHRCAHTRVPQHSHTHSCRLPTFLSIATFVWVKRACDRLTPVVLTHVVIVAAVQTPDREAWKKTCLLGLKKTKKHNEDRSWRSSSAPPPQKNNWTPTTTVKHCKRHKRVTCCCWCMWSEIWSSLEVCSGEQNCTDSSKYLQPFSDIPGRSLLQWDAAFRKAVFHAAAVISKATASIRVLYKTESERCTARDSNCAASGFT